MLSRISGLTASVGLAAALAACGSSEAPPPATPAIDGARVASAEPGECVVALPGVSVTAREISGGAEIHLVGDRRRAGQLRALGRSVASLVQDSRPEPTGEPVTLPPHSGAGVMPQPGESPDIPIVPDLRNRPGQSAVPGSATSAGSLGDDKPMSVDAAIIDVAGGVHIVVTARVASDVDRLRLLMRSYADRLRDGDCFIAS